MVRFASYGELFQLGVYLLWEIECQMFRQFFGVIVVIAQHLLLQDSCGEFDPPFASVGIEPRIGNEEAVATDLEADFFPLLRCQ